MKRQLDLSEHTDGSRYQMNDMVKVGCSDCEGCSSCCRGMGDSIILDPYDIYRLCKGTGKSIEELMSMHLKLTVIDGIVLPVLKMGENDCCTFLDDKGRCSIHDSRTGFCRLFPLGRLYEAGSFSYILQVNECRAENRTKVKVKKWMDTPNLAVYDKYIVDWHYLLMSLEEELSGSEDDEKARHISVSLLTAFFLTPYELLQDFYPQFYERFDRYKREK